MSRYRNTTLKVKFSKGQNAPFCLVKVKANGERCYFIIRREKGSGKVIAHD